MFDKEALAEKVLEVGKSQLLKRFEGFSKTSDCMIVETSIEEAAVNVNHRSEIFLYGVDITIRLQLFYHLENSQIHLKNVLRNISDEQCIDFFNELCNLICGKLKEQFIGQGIVVAISLPIDIESSQKKIVMAKEVLPHARCFELVDGEGRKLFSSQLSLEIHDLDNFKAYSVSLDNILDEGEVEFL